MVRYADTQAAAVLQVARAAQSQSGAGATSSPTDVASTAAEEVQRVEFLRRVLEQRQTLATIRKAQVQYPLANAFDSIEEAASITVRRMTGREKLQNSAAKVQRITAVTNSFMTQKQKQKQKQEQKPATT